MFNITLIKLHDYVQMEKVKNGDIDLEKAPLKSLMFMVKWIQLFVINEMSKKFS